MICYFDLAVNEYVAEFRNQPGWGKTQKLASMMAFQNWLRMRAPELF